MPLTIAPAESPEDLAHIRALFTEYHAWLGADLCFQGFQEELRCLEEKYERLLLARWGGEVCGCVGLWARAEGVCEMKRLFVRDAYKGRGIGRRLSERIIAEGRALGYASMVLDTLERLQPAIQLYEQLGFRRRGAYYTNPLDGVVYMELSLRACPIRAPAS